MGIKIHATKYSWHNMSYIETCTVVIDILHIHDIGRIGVLVDGIHYLEPQKHPLRCHKGTRNSALLRSDTLIIAVFLC